MGLILKQNKSFTFLFIISKTNQDGLMIMHLYVNLNLHSCLQNKLYKNLLKIVYFKKVQYFNIYTID